MKLVHDVNEGWGLFIRLMLHVLVSSVQVATQTSSVDGTCKRILWLVNAQQFQCTTVIFYFHF